MNDKRNRFTVMPHEDKKKCDIHWCELDAHFDLEVDDPSDTPAIEDTLCVMHTITGIMSLIEGTEALFARKKMEERGIQSEWIRVET